MSEVAAVLNKARGLDKKYMTFKRRKLYIACEHFDFSWYSHEILAVRELWKNMISITTIAKMLGRHLNELVFLIIDQSPKYMKHRQGKITNDVSSFEHMFNQDPVNFDEEKYHACERYNFIWDEQEVYKLRHLWKSGASIFYISEMFKRNVNEVAFLIVDQADQGYIKARKGGVLGEFFESKCD
ncbi:hypothetical protein ABE354_08695 [Brevibacillus laterosporus]|uniref:hypothetical protein n=1 Tax=Brevibacillus laterosporus TaxID=1465 RepID=UPI003D1AE286